MFALLLFSALPLDARDTKVVVVDRIELNYVYDSNANLYLIQFIFWKGGDWISWKRADLANPPVYDFSSKRWLLFLLGERYGFVIFAATSYSETHTQYDPAPGSTRIRY